MRKICEEIWRHTDENLLRWYGHVGCTVGDGFVKIFYSMVKDSERRGQAQKRKTNWVKKLCRTRGISDEDVREMIFWLFAMEVFYV